MLEQNDGMTSNKPYLLRAIYDWLVDNGLTPHLMVDAEVEGVQVPSQYINEGQVILNIGPSAVQSLHLGNDWIMFSARFGGVAMEIQVPPAAVMGIYARENGRGMLFPKGEEDEHLAGQGMSDDEPDPPEPQPPKPRPNLRIVK